MTSCCAEPLTATDLQDELRAMADFYRFLSNALLYEFSADQLEQLAQLPVPEGDSPVARGIAQLKQSVRTCGFDPRTELACEYARVFLSAGVYDGLTAEPYESVFTSEEQIMMQEARDSVVRLYREQGLQIDPELHMPEDHLGLELGFLAFMAQRASDAIDPHEPLAIAGELAADLTTMRDFAADHVLNWVPDLAKVVDEYARLPFYPALVRIVEAYTGTVVLNLEALLEA